MNKFRFLLFCTLLQVSLKLSAGTPPTVVQDSLRSLYPKVKTIGWGTDSNYYVATFQYKGVSTKVWFTTKGQWVMKQTDWQVMDEVPDAVYHTFTFGPYSTDEVLDVTYVEFPNQPALIVVCIGIDNEETEYQLFYRSDGELINARNVTFRNNILGASTFL